MNKAWITSRRELLILDKRGQELVLRYMAKGWRVRLSSNNHMIMYSPKGTGTYSISRHLDTQRKIQNAEAGMARIERNET